jgi:hypothetical protein
MRSAKNTGQNWQMSFHRLFLLGAAIVVLLSPARLPAETNRGGARRSLNFENDIIPILDRYGCNSSGCHGKAEGQNGFKLSVFGFDPQADYRALVMEGRGRRVFLAAPERSLLLQKVSGGLPHGGGVRIDPQRPEYQTLYDWVASGAPFGSPDDPRVVSIAVLPTEGQMEMGATQPLQVTATWSDGYQQNVTQLASFQSNHEALATVDEQGIVTAGDAPGSVAVMATYLGHVDLFTAIVPQGGAVVGDSVTESSVINHNIVDTLIHQRLRTLNVLPSQPTDDATYLRRVYLDIIGTLPTANESRVFLSDERPNRRAHLVDELLKRPEYADYWALKWADLLRVNRRALGRKNAYLYYQWIHDSFVGNKPLDKFARQVITAEGPLDENPAAHFYKVVSKPNDMANTVAQVFLGVRIECAQCHHHPFDRWSQTDYYGMQAFFTEVTFKTSTHGDTLLSTGKAKTKHPRTGEAIAAHALGERPTTEQQPEPLQTRSRRKRLAHWMTNGENNWFSRNLSNRLWAHFMGRGLVEPVDDFRLTNPPSNAALLDALADHLVASGFDQHQLIRLITASAAYQRSATPNEANRSDQQAYSRFMFKRIDAEVLFDAVCQTTGSIEKFPGVPAGSRAIQLWDSEVPHYFLRLFGRPVRATACECERVAEPTVGQVLHVLNSPEIQEKLSYVGGRIAILERQFSQDDMLVDELYLTFFSRHPSADERLAATEYLERNEDRQIASEDLAWSMLNSLEFLFNH